MNRLIQRFVLSVLLVSAIVSNASAVTSINVTATLGTTTGNYSTLKAAFDKINDGTHQGVITIRILFSTTETAAATLNATGSGSASYTAVSVIPTGTAAVSGTISSAGSALIVLNGASNVTIDGRVSGSGKYLTLRNTYSSAASTQPTVQFTNGTSNCFIRNCIIENNSTTSAAVNVTATGTNSAEIAYNDIRDATGGTTGSPYCGIYGDNSPANSFSIYNNNIFNFARYGIYLYNAADNAVITNNNIYNTANQATPQCGISIGTIGGLACAGSGYTITGNYIGGQAASCGGSAWANSGGSFYGIYVKIGATYLSSVSNNQVGNINMSGTDAYTFTGIYIAGGQVTVGYSGNGNTIGHATDNAKGITNAGTSTTCGIYVNSTSASIVNYNTVSYLSASEAGSSQVQVIGINVAYSVGTSCTNNTVKNLTTASISAGTDLSSSAIGMRVTFGSGAVSISRNSITNVSNTSSGNPVNVIGLLCDLRTGTYTIDRNTISNLSASNSNICVINGIYAYYDGGTCSYNNNMISLGDALSNSYAISGILDMADAANVSDSYYFNTVYIGGSSVTGSTNTYALNSNLTTTRNIKNNIFVNTRSNGTGTGKHYAVKYASGGTLVADYNNFIASGTGATFGYFGADVADAAAWKTATTNDANSVSRTVNFLSTTDLHLTAGSLGDVNLAGTPISGISTDYDGQTRNATSPYMGADENTGSPLPVELTGFTATAKDKSVTLHWVTATETNNYGFEIECREKAEDSRRLSWTKAGFVEGHGTTNTPQSYSYVDKPGDAKYQYRLKQIDREGKFEYSNVVEVTIAAPSVFALNQNFPNPFNPTTNITFTVPVNGHATLKVFNTIGQEVATLFDGVAGAGRYESAAFDASHLASGIYFARLESGGQAQMRKLMLMR